MCVVRCERVCLCVRHCRGEWWRWIVSKARRGEKEGGAARGKVTAPGEGGGGRATRLVGRDVHEQRVDVARALLARERRDDLVGHVDAARVGVVLLAERRLRERRAVDDAVDGAERLEGAVEALARREVDLEAARRLERARRQRARHVRVADAVAAVALELLHEDLAEVAAAAGHEHGAARAGAGAGAAAAAVGSGGAGHDGVEPREGRNRA